MNAMHANSQPQSRWAAFVERCDERVTRFRQHFDPFSDTVDRRRKVRAMVALSIGVLALGALLVFGTIWIVEHYKLFNHHWVLIVPYLKLWKLFGIGAAIVGAFLFRDKLTGTSPAAGAKTSEVQASAAQSAGTTPAKQ